MDCEQIELKQQRQNVVLNKTRGGYFRTPSVIASTHLLDDTFIYTLVHNEHLSLCLSWAKLEKTCWDGAELCKGRHDAFTLLMCMASEEQSRGLCTLMCMEATHSAAASGFCIRL